jgi:hypothetical protein
LVTSFTAFTVSSGTCTTLAYTLTKSDGTAIDTTIFSFTTSPLQLSTYTTLATNIATYSFILKATLTGDVQTASATFTVVINSKCYGQTLTASTMTAGAY